MGTEGGFLPNPVSVPSNVPFDEESREGSLVLAPAERADIIINFEGFTGRKLILYNDAPAPFPDGDERNDYFPGAPENPTVSTPGFGPNTRQIMRFKVVPATSADPPLDISPCTDLTAGNDPLLVPLGVTTPPPGVTVRSLTLNETFDAYGRLIQLLGTNVPPVNRGHGFGRAYMDSATETPANGDIEVWQIANLTGDTHPIHFHLVNVQIISRQSFKVSNYNGAPTYTEAARPPGSNEEEFSGTVPDLLAEFNQAFTTGDGERGEAILGELEELTASTESPGDRLIRLLHPWSSFLVLPIFALANAGILWTTEMVRQALTGPVPVSRGIIFGLLVGKVVGIVSFSFLAVRTGLARLIDGMSWLYVLGVGVLGGIGFTVSLFIVDLAFTDPITVARAKFGVIIGSLIAGLAAYVLLRSFAVRPERRGAAAEEAVSL